VRSNEGQVTTIAYRRDFSEYAVAFAEWEFANRSFEDVDLRANDFVYADPPRICTLYRSLGYRLRFLQAPRRISCTGDRTPATEVLALRTLPE
jgi:DNA adenine methylase